MDKANKSESSLQEIAMDKKKQNLAATGEPVERGGVEAIPLEEASNKEDTNLSKILSKMNVTTSILGPGATNSGVLYKPTATGPTFNFNLSNPSLPANTPTPANPNLLDIDENLKANILELTKKGQLINLQTLFKGKDAAALLEICDEKQNQLLAIACMIGHIKMVNWMIGLHADVDHRNEDGVTAFLFAAYYGHRKVMKELAQGRDEMFWQQKDKGNNTALLKAAVQGHLELMQWLVDKKKARLDETNKFGYTALHLAVLYNDHFQVVRWLVEVKKMDLTLTTDAGYSVLDIAKKNEKIAENRMVSWIQDQLSKQQQIIMQRRQQVQAEGQHIAAKDEARYQHHAERRNHNEAPETRFVNNEIRRYAVLQQEGVEPTGRQIHEGDKIENMLALTIDKAQAERLLDQFFTKDETKKDKKKHKHHKEKESFQNKPAAIHVSEKDNSSNNLHNQFKNGTTIDQQSHIANPAQDDKALSSLGSSQGQNSQHSSPSPVASSPAMVAGPRPTGSMSAAPAERMAASGCPVGFQPVSITEGIKALTALAATNLPKDGIISVGNYTGGNEVINNKPGGPVISLGNYVGGDKQYNDVPVAAQTSGVGLGKK